MFLHTKHTYLEYCNKEINWLPADTEELYLKNLETNWGSLNVNGWIDDPHFTYKFNSHGFRSDEFNHEPSILFLGCSHTAGIGMPVEKTWTRIVAKELGLKCFNLGIGASSNDTAFRLGHHYIPQIKPKLVIFLSTDNARTELFSNDHIENWSIWNQTYDPTRWGYYIENWILNDANSEMNFLKNKLALEHICNTNNIKFLHRKVGDVLYNLDLARDLMHYGVKSNKVCSQKILHLL